MTVRSHADATRTATSLWIPALLGLVAIVVYVALPSVNAPFYFEDRALLGSGVPTGAAGEVPGAEALLEVPPLRRPVTVFSYSVDAALADGGAETASEDRAVRTLSARVAHTHSLVLHVIVVILLTLLVRRLFPGAGPWAALGAGAAMGLHPMQAEAIGYAAARHHVLATVFYLATLLMFAGLCKRGATGQCGLRWRQFTVVILAACALGASEMALSLPVALVAVLCLVRAAAPPAATADAAVASPASVGTPLDGGGARAWTRPLAAIAILTAAWCVALLTPGLAATTARPTQWGDSATTAVATALLATKHAVQRVCWPTDLAIDYSFDAFPTVQARAIPADVAVALAAWVAALAFACWRWRRGDTIAALAWSLPAALLLPAVLLPTLVADQTQYLPMLGWIFLAAACLRPLVQRAPVIAVVIVAGAALIWAGSLRERLSGWEYRFQFWEQAATAAPRCVGSQVRLGTEALQLNRSAEALLAFRTACETAESVARSARRQVPLYHHALLQRIRILMASKSPADWQRARELLVATGDEVDAEGARLLDRPEVLFELFRNSEQVGQRVDAIAAAEKLRAVGADSPYRFDALLYLAGVRHEEEQTTAAWALLREAETACTSREQWSRLYYRRGLHQLHDKEWSLAREEFQESARRLEGTGNWETALYLAAECWVHEGKPQEAVQALQSLSQQAPDHLPTLISLGDIQVSLDRFDEAEGNYRRVLAKQPGSPKALAGLDAIKARKRAAEETPADDPGKEVRAYLNAGRDLLQTQSYDRAAEAFRQARDRARALTRPEALPLKCEAYLAYARGLTRALQYEAASVVYEEFFAFAPVSERGHAALEAGEVLRLRGLLRDSMALMTREWELGARAPGLAMNLGGLAVRMRDRAATLRWYGEALKDPKLDDDDRKQIEKIVEQLTPSTPPPAVEAPRVETPGVETPAGTPPRDPPPAEGAGHD